MIKLFIAVFTAILLQPAAELSRVMEIFPSNADATCNEEFENIASQDLTVLRPRGSNAIPKPRLIKRNPKTLKPLRMLARVTVAGVHFQLTVTSSARNTSCQIPDRA